jgi:aryl-alcohol dehydrogenase-like predicted oxidoreductase
MQYQELGNTSTSFSRLCLGTMTFGDVLQQVAWHKATIAQVALGWQLHQGFVIVR